MVTITNHTYIITPSSLSFILHCLRFQQSAPLFPILSYSTNISPSSFKSPSFPYSLSEGNRKKIRTVRNPYPISQNSFLKWDFRPVLIFFSVLLIVLFLTFLFFHHRTVFTLSSTNLQVLDYSILMLLPFLLCRMDSVIYWASICMSEFQLQHILEFYNASSN